MKEMKLKERAYVEIANYYENKNKETSVKKDQENLAKKNLRRHKCTLLIIVIVIFIIFFLILYYISKIYSTSIWLVQGIIFFILGYGLILLIILNSIYYFFYKDDERYKFNIKSILGIITIFILMGQFYVSISQNKISQNQEKLMEAQLELFNRTTGPREAFLEFIPDKRNLCIPSYKLNEKMNLVNDPNSRWAKIDLTLINFGQMDSNNVACYVVSPNKSIAAYITPDDNYLNIDAGSSNRSVLHLKYSECYEHHETMCDRPDLVPKGDIILTFKCECYGCKSQRTFTQNISVFIYNESHNECPNI